MTDAPSTSAYDLSAPAEPEHRATFAVIVDNEPGVLHRVVGMFAADHVLAKIKAQLEKMIQVRQVIDVGADDEGVERELALFKVQGTGAERIEALRLADIFRAHVVDTTLQSFIFEVTGAPAKIDKFERLMRPLGLVEISRTGVLSISRGAERI
jgi:acetolactate synthase-1/3 small subunit